MLIRIGVWFTTKINVVVHTIYLAQVPGPLVRLWMMRFEGRHSYFKRLATQMGNFINISYSLSMRHQRLQCYYQLNQHAMDGEDIEVGPGERDGGRPTISSRLYR